MEQPMDEFDFSCQSSFYDTKLSLTFGNGALWT
jgi:hypothetical protein